MYLLLVLYLRKEKCEKLISYMCKCVSLHATLCGKCVWETWGTLHCYSTPHLTLFNSQRAKNTLLTFLLLFVGAIFECIYSLRKFRWWEQINFPSQPTYTHIFSHSSYCLWWFSHAMFLSFFVLYILAN